MWSPCITALRTGVRSYAKKAKLGGAGKVVAATSSKGSAAFNPETDPQMLSENCCINYRVDEKPIPLKEDSEYPDWLWNLRIERDPIPLDQLSPDTHYYWRRVRKENTRFFHRLAKIDRWHKKSSIMDDNHLARFYGDWYYIIRRHEQSKEARLNDSTSEHATAKS